MREARRRRRATERWRQAFGADYHYTGRTNRALPLPEKCLPILAWSQQAIHENLNGLLLNWYDGQLGHSIGPHHDQRTGLVVGPPIVTISFGEKRIFRLSHRQAKSRDFPARDGTVFIMPWETNLAWRHGVPHFARWRGRSVSITIRAFTNARWPSASDGKAKATPGASAGAPSDPVASSGNPGCAASRARA